MSTRRSHSFLALALAFSCSFAPAAYAIESAQQIAGALDQMAIKIGQEEQARAERTIQAYQASTNKYIEAMNKVHKLEMRESMTPMLDANLQTVLLSIPSANALSSMLVTSGMEGRYRELNLITTPNVPMADGLIDPTKGSLSNEVSNFRVWMEYFCDPRADGGRMGKIGFDSARMYQIEDRNPSYKYVCGNKRTEALGTVTADQLNANDTPAAQKHNQIIGMPLQPGRLFFEAQTYPSSLENAQGVQNENKLGFMTYAAYRYFERLVLGKPADKNTLAYLDTSSGRQAYVQEQGRIARQMIASYPFAMLFSERVGVMYNNPTGTNDPGALSPPMAAANMLRQGWQSATTDDALMSVIKTLETQPSMSMAQYMDIMMYKVPMSPGYLTRVSNLTTSQLMREKVFLLGLQNVLRYEINRWMEVSVAIEAVRR